jgi:FkbM family methyltransferase
MPFLKNIFKITENKLLPKADKIQKYIQPYLEAGSNINLVDIGAHSGSFTDDIEKYYVIENAILAEPIPSLASHLNNKYQAKKYSIYPNVVSEKDGDQIDFYINEFAETSSILKIQTQMEELSEVKAKLVEKVTVTTRTLDALVKQENFSKIDLLKIDVQGSEHLVIKGAEIALKKTRFVWIELSLKPLYHGTSMYYEIIKQMQESGFILLELSPGYRSPKQELLQVDALFSNNLIV